MTNRVSRLRRSSPKPAPSGPMAVVEPLERRALLSATWIDAIIGLALDPVAADQSVEDDGDDDDDGREDGENEDDDNEGRKKQKKAKKQRGSGDGRGNGRGNRDDVAPSAQIDAGNLAGPGAEPHAVTVTYTDDKRVRARTVDVNDIVVTGGAGGDLAVSRVTLSPESDSDRIVATYFLAAPGGRWDAADNGDYAVTLQPGQVTDTRGQAAAGASAGFKVAIATADNAAPTASLAVSNVTVAGGDSGRVTVTYADDVGINPATIGKVDLTITGPGGVRGVRSVDVDTTADGTRSTATYTFDAPGSSWGPEDNGAYTVTLNAGEVKDASGKGATGGPASFTVNVPRPEPVDPGFGGGSTVSTGIVAEAVVAQDDGKILVAGRTGDLAAGRSQAVLQRFNADGTPDPTFGVRGRVVTAAGANDAFYALAVRDGQIVAAGTRGGDVLVSRFTPGGAPDAGFGKGGSAVTDFGAADDAAYAVALAPDASVLVAAGPGGNFALARFGPAGTPDPAFGQGGKQLFDLGGADVPGAVAVQDDGKAVVVGTSDGKVAVVRVRADGEADPTFSGDGLLLLDALAARADAANFADRSTAVALQPDGKLLLANRSAGGDFAVARLTADGKFDASFGAAGVSTIDFGGEDDADAVLVQDTGEILVIGTTLANGVAGTGVAALDASGKPIAEFGDGGRLRLAADVASPTRELRMGDPVLRAFGTRQSDGRLVIGTRGDAPQANTLSSLRRLNVPGTRAQPLGTQLGTFGVANGKRSTLTATDADGTRLTFSASRGSGVAYVTPAGVINLTINDDSGGAAVTIRTAGGADGRVTLGDVSVGGSLRSLTARTADLTGTLFVSGSITRLALGNVAGGTVAAAGSIASANLASLSDARVMSGAGLGAHGQLGGEGADADSFIAGSIGTLRVLGPIERSTVSAGLDPVDGVFNNDDDRVVGAAESVIRSVAARGADAASRFIAGRIVALKLPGIVDLASDGRVTLLG